MGRLELFFDQFYSIISTFTVSDLIDIVICAVAIYKIIQMVRETRASALLKGLMFLVGCYVFAALLQLRTLAFALEKIFEIGILAVIVLFQPELRRMLEKFGRTKVVSEISILSGDSPERKAILWEKSINDICEAVEELSADKTGALIVIECKTRLGEQIDTGVQMNSLTSKELFGNIFISNTPLHDGAVIIRNGIILAAACFLPKPQDDKSIETKLGSRHRAAIGMSEASDAIVIVVSEETGTVSVARDGVLTRGYNKITLKEYLTGQLIPSGNNEKSGKLSQIIKKLDHLKSDKKGVQNGEQEKENKE